MKDPFSLYVILPGNGLDPGVSIQHVDSRVSLVLQHLVEGEDVLVVAAARQVGVLDAAVGDCVLRRQHFAFGQNFLPIFFDQLIFGALDALVKKVDQPNGVAGSGKSIDVETFIIKNT